MPPNETSSGITRRRFVAGTVGGGAAMLGPGALADARVSALEADVVVVGAGLAGLSAARAIHRAGRSVVVLEARDRVGGRCFSRSLGRGASDVANMGATFVGPTQHRIQALMKDVGISKYPTYATGKLIWYDEGKATPYTGLIPPSADAGAVVELGTQVIPTLDRMAATVPLDAPWKAPNAELWDSMTLDSWSRENVSSPDARALVALALENVISVEPRDVSLLYWLFYAHAAGGVEPLIANAGQGGAQDFRVSGGTQRIALQLARRLGDRVRLGHPVRAISQGPHGVTVSSDGLSVSARRVIVAIPPNLAGRIVYSPGLPPLRDQLTQRVPVGSLIKSIAVYDRPFWRDQGLNGQSTSVEPPVGATFDCSPRSGRPGVLMGFISGDDARQLSSLSAAARKRSWLASYARMFGSQAAHPHTAFDQVWDREIYTGGCPGGVTPPGVLTEYGRALRAPVGRIHWAGTETATEWVGYMDGAVQSGDRAAGEVLAQL